jgi:hypothetical protein
MLIRAILENAHSQIQIRLLYNHKITKNTQKKKYFIILIFLSLILCILGFGKN